jgi:hypothetical protein
MTEHGSRRADQRDIEKYFVAEFRSVRGDEHHRSEARNWRWIMLGSDAALFSHLLIGSIDGGDFLGRKRHEFRRHTTRDHLVRVIIEDELTVVVLQHIIVDFGRYPQNLVRIAFSRTHMARFDVVELSRGESESLGYVS